MNVSGGPGPAAFVIITKLGTPNAEGQLFNMSLKDHVMLKSILAAYISYIQIVRTAAKLERLFISAASL